MSFKDGNSFSVDTKSIENGKKVIKILVFLVYFAGALFATLAFQREVSSLFEGMSPALSVLATIGAWANFLSVVVMLWAKDYWISGSVMKWTAIVGWVIEILMMAANTLAAYGSTWTAGWVQVSPATPVYVIFLWGLLWLESSDHKQREKLMSFHNKVQESWMDKLDRAMDAPEVQETLNLGAMRAAKRHAEQAFNVRINSTYTDDLTQGETRRQLPGGNQSPAARRTANPFRLYNAARHGHASETVSPPAVKAEGDNSGPKSEGTNSSIGQGAGPVNGKTGRNFTRPR